MTANGTIRGRRQATRARSREAVFSATRPNAAAEPNARGLSSLSEKKKKKEGGDEQSASIGAPTPSGASRRQWTGPHPPTQNPSPRASPSISPFHSAPYTPSTVLQRKPRGAPGRRRMESRAWMMMMRKRRDQLASFHYLSFLALSLDPHITAGTRTTRRSSPPPQHLPSSSDPCSPSSSLL